MVVVDRDQLDGWLARLRGPSFVDFATFEAAAAAADEQRDAAVVEMRAAGADALFPFLVPMLAGDNEARCEACEAILRADPVRGLELVLPLLNDLDDGVRYFACECLAEFGGEVAVPALLSVLRSHTDPSLRCTAAMGLGKQGGPEVIPALLAAMASDHEFDELGHSPSHCASSALDDVLGTEETRLRFGNFCRLPDREPDLDRLRRLAEERYRQWQAGSEPGDGADGGGTNLSRA